MPATVTAKNACGAKIMLADTLGTLQDISGSSNEVNIKYEQELGEYKVFGSKYLQRLSCGEDVSLDMTIVFTTATNEGKDLLKSWKANGGSRRVKVNLPDGGAGSDEFDGFFIWDTIEIPAKADEAKPIMIKASLKSSGEVTWGTAV